VRIYLAAPLFNQMQRAWNRALAAGVEEMLDGASVTLPQDFRPAGRYNDRRHYGQIFRLCLEAIRASDALLAVLDGPEVDSGTAFEMGVAYAEGVPVVGLRTDYRPGPEHGVNMMCSRACRYLVREFGFQESPRSVARAAVRRLGRIGREDGRAKRGEAHEDG
jgi:nucleoside 2-deoxyribosyltransferase